MCLNLQAQEKVEVYGTALDSAGKKIGNVSIYVLETRESFSANDSGYFEFAIPANKKITLEFSHVAHNPISININAKDRTKIKLTMESSLVMTAKVNVDAKKQSGGIKINSKHLNNLPSAGGDALDIIKSQPGVSSNNELSSQYSVRGGNFDENLIYVNGIEIFRPMLVRAGEQEGLSFVNADMVDNINFYAGGFEARYGDKMSSVLDITYKRPDSAASSLNLSFLGFRAHTEGKLNKKGTYLLGFRQKSNAYLLNTSDTKGTYKPNFIDFQSYITYPLSEKWDISFLGNAARNQYISIPENRTTRFGGINNAFEMKVYFNGQENDIFESYFGAVSAEYNPNHRLKSRFTISAFNSYEQVAFDIEGQYALNQLETDLGSTDFGKVAFNLGTGAFLNHTRSQLNSSIINLENFNEYKMSNGSFLFGLKYQIEMVNASYKEWQYLDSAGYSLPKSTDEIVLPVLIQAKNTLQTNRYSAFLQRNWTLLENKKTGRDLSVFAGIRANYWDYNKQVVVSPRVSISFIPSNKINDSLRFSYRAYVGVYQQPPLYKELRNLEFELQSGVMAQTSIQYGAAMNMMFYMWNRPFKLATEAYFKDLYNLIPYNVDQVQINYFGKNDARGYARGIEGRLNGEFVKGLESWLSVTYMTSKENLNSDFYYRKFNANGEEINGGFATSKLIADSVLVNPGYIHRPTDQRVNISLFFQDEMPRFPAFKLHLNLTYGTGYPFGQMNSAQYRNAFRIPDYKRVDIGFSYELIQDKMIRRGKKLKAIKPNSLLRFCDNLMFRLEVFNLLDIQNTVSYLWIKDVSNSQYAVPNHLTGRLLNFRVLAKF